MPRAICLVSTVSRSIRLGVETQHCFFSGRNSLAHRGVIKISASHHTSKLSSLLATWNEFCQQPIPSKIIYFSKSISHLSNAKISTFSFVLRHKYIHCNFTSNTNTFSRLASFNLNCSTKMSTLLLLLPLLICIAATSSYDWRMWVDSRNFVKLWVDQLEVSS